MNTRCFLRLTAVLLTAAFASASAMAASPAPIAQMAMVTETSGPFKAPAPWQGNMPTTGQGYWKFVAAKDLLPPPEEIKPSIKGAHGCIIVDGERDTIYWGLKKVGMVAFSNRLSQSWVVKGDSAFVTGNLHGADILPRPGRLPLVLAADDEEGEVYLSDTTFKNTQKLTRPEGGAYTNSKAPFKPTDAAFIDEKTIFVGDGYGSHWLMTGTLEPLRYDGAFIGGNEMSRTPHGITKYSHRHSMLIAARPEAAIKEYDYQGKKWLEPMGLPPGSTVCDLDVWGDYALAPCLDGPNKSVGPIYIVNLKTRTIASIIRLKEDLGFDDALHLHDAAWYVRGTGNNREVYVLFTNWNPGGIGAIKLVNAPEAK